MRVFADITDPGNVALVCGQAREKAESDGRSLVDTGYEHGSHPRLKLGQKYTYGTSLGISQIPGWSIERTIDDRVRVLEDATMIGLVR